MKKMAKIKRYLSENYGGIWEDKWIVLTAILGAVLGAGLGLFLSEQFLFDYATNEWQALLIGQGALVLLMPICAFLGYKLGQVIQNKVDARSASTIDED